MEDDGASGGERQSKQQRTTEKLAENNRATAESDGTSGVELMEQVTERARWTAMEQATESVT